MLWLVVFGLLAAKVLFSLNIAWNIFNFAFQVDESESMIVAETVMMSRGVDIFAPPNPDVFISAPYTPFYYWLNWPILHLIGPSFKPGRFISFLAAGGIAWLIYRFVSGYAARRTGRTDQLAGLLAALAWASLGVVAFWGSAVKPDMTALFLSLSGLYLIFEGKREKRKEKSFQPLTPETFNPKSPVPEWGEIQNPKLYAAAALFALAALTKQTAIAGVLVAGLWLLLNAPFGRRWLRVVQFSATYLTLALGPMLLMNVLSNGGFWYHVVTVHELPWNANNYWKFLGGFVQSYQFLVGLAFAFVLFWLSDVLSGSLALAWARVRNDYGTFIVLYAGVAFGAGLSAGTYGGNHNHFLEMAAAGCIALGAVFVRLNEWGLKSLKGSRASWRRWPLVAALILIGWQGLGYWPGEARVKPSEFPLLGAVAPAQSVLQGLRGQFFNPDWLGLEYRVPPENQKQRLAEIAAFMNNDAGRLIYSDNVSLMLATTKPLFTTDPFTQTHATFYGRWDESKLVAMVQEQKFSLIVLRQPIERRLEAGQRPGDIFLSPGLARAVTAHYRLACRDTAPIYVPNSRTDFKGC